MGNKMKKIWTLFLVAFLLGFLSTDLLSQGFINNGNYNATCGAVIKLNATNAQITGSSNLGQSAATAIPGVVEWASTSANQVVQPYYYQRLVVSGGSKVMSDGIRVVGEACPTPLSGYAQLSTYPFYSTASSLNFGTGTFYYAATGSQNIYPTTDAYYILNTSSQATVVAATTVTAYQVTATEDFTVDGTLNLGAGTSTFSNTSDVTLAGTGTVNTGAGSVTFSGTVTTAQNSNFNVTGTGNVTFNNTLALNGTLTANDGGAGNLGTVTFGGATTIGSTGSINLGTGNNLVISSSITNAGNGTNLLFACGSNITYNGGIQTIMPTLNQDGNRYGNLFLSGTGLKTGGTASYGNDINVCGNFSLDGGNLDMVANGGTFRMSTPTATATYTGMNEVAGLFSRVTNTSAQAYTFNNTATIITLAADNDNPTSITLNVRPNTNPFDYNATSDVNRKINLAYAGNAGDFSMTVRAGYREDERTNWNAPYTQASLRFYEASNAPAREKVGTGQVYARSAATPSALGYVELAGIGNTSNATLPNGIGLFASGNDLVLAAGPTTFYSIADGRWTNPATWDEGTVPSSIDNVEIRTLVYAGIDGPFAGTPATGNTTSEFDHYTAAAGDGNAPVANTIIVANLPNAAFLLGNEDNPATYKFATSSTTGITFTNLNTNTMQPAFGTGIAAKGSFVTNPGFNGVWIVPYGANPATLQTNAIQNNGTINNEGIIEINQ